MKTRDLIRQWSMSGAGRDIAGRFRSGTDLRQAITTQGHEERPAPERGAGFMVKEAGGDDWTPLATG